MGWTVAMIAGATAASPLASYLDHARVLVISAPAPDDPGLRRQDAELNQAAAGLKARDVVVIHAIGPGDPEGPQSAAGLRAAVGLHADRFGLALVGKDGGVKLERQSPVPVRVLFQTIDAMPMRREEMRRASPG